MINNYKSDTYYERIIPTYTFVLKKIQLSLLYPSVSISLVQVWEKGHVREKILCLRCAIWLTAILREAGGYDLLSVRTYSNMGCIHYVKYKGNTFRQRGKQIHTKWQNFCRSWGLKDSSCELGCGGGGRGVVEISQKMSLESGRSQITQGLYRAWEADECNSQGCHMPLRVKENQCCDFIQISEKIILASFFIFLHQSVTPLTSYIVIQI